ncbi:MAG: DUF1552 domain-containing protein [Bdellovibrionales bacterium]
MANRQLSRRHFLRGAGGLTIALPFLRSLSPWMSCAEAATLGSPKRFVAFVNFDGYYETVYYPSAEANVKIDNQTFYKRLTDISGPLSETFGAEFDGLRSKMNIYRGLDIVGSVGHSAANALCAAAREVFGDTNPIDPIGNSRSIDVVLSKSKTFYPTEPAFFALRGQENSYNFSTSFDKDTSGKTVRLPFTKLSKDMFQMVFGNRISDPALADQLKTKKVLIGDLVLEDYKSLVNNRRISSEDKLLVNNFVDNLQALNKKINSSTTLSCSTPTLRAQPFYYDLQNHEEEWSNFIDVMVSAMACDLTRICVLSARIWGHDHGLSHGSFKDRTNQLKYISNAKKLVKVVKEFATKMDSVQDSNGKTMLDNSVLLWGMEQGDGSGHSCYSMPAITFGSAGGALKTGYYMDYRIKPLTYYAGRSDIFPGMGSRTYNSLLITIMRALGLPDSEFMQYGDGGGYGTYSLAKLAYHRGQYTPFQSLRNATLPIGG